MTDTQGNKRPLAIWIGAAYFLWQSLTYVVAVYALTTVGGVEIISARPALKVIIPILAVLSTAQTLSLFFMRRESLWIFGIALLFSIQDGIMGGPSPLCPDYSPFTVVRDALPILAALIYLWHLDSHGLLGNKELREGV